MRALNTCSEVRRIALKCIRGTKRGYIWLESTAFDNITLFLFSGVVTVRDRGVASLGEPG